MDILKLSGLIFLGGGLGSVLRFLLSRLQFQILPSNFPIATVLANILACTLLGVIVYTSKSKVDDSIWLKYFLVVGVCGGFSTFSAFGFETVSLLKSGHLILAALNVIISLGLGFSILWVFTKV
jgi:CrcB protein